MGNAGFISSAVGPFGTVAFPRVFFFRWFLVQIPRFTARAVGNFGGLRTFLGGFLYAAVACKAYLLLL